MDPTSMTFYAIVCGVLGVSAPRFDSAWFRLAFGAVIGVIAAFALPYIRQMIGQ